MRHKMNSMSASSLTHTSSLEYVWFVDSIASNNITSHEEWFCDSWMPDWPNYVETEDDTTRPIQYVGNIPFDKEGKNVLHVSTSEQGMLVRYNHGLGCFIKKEGSLIARRWREGQMFILDSNEVKSAMFVKGHKADTNIEFWHKRIGHINLQRLQEMQWKGVVIGLSVFESKQVDRMCKSFLLDKQHRIPFPKESYANKGLLDVIHSDLWGPTETPTIGGCRYYVTLIEDYSPTRGSSRWRRRVKCSPTSKSSRTKSKKKSAGIFNAYDRIEERSTSPTNSSTIFNVRE